MWFTYHGWVHHAAWLIEAATQWEAPHTVHSHTQTFAADVVSSQTLLAVDRLHAAGFTNLAWLIEAATHSEAPHTVFSVNTILTLRFLPLL